MGKHRVAEHYLDPINCTVGANAMFTSATLYRNDGFIGEKEITGKDMCGYKPKFIYIYTRTYIFTLGYSKKCRCT